MDCMTALAQLLEHCVQGAAPVADTAAAPNEYDPAMHALGTLLAAPIIWAVLWVRGARQ